MRCRATFALIHLSCHQQFKDNLDHGAILVGEKKGSAQNRSRFWICALKCHFCLDISHQQFTLMLRPVAAGHNTPDVDGLSSTPPNP